MTKWRVIVLLAAVVCCAQPFSADADDAVFELAGEQLKSGKYEEAERLFSTAIELNPKDARAYSSRAVARIFLGRYGPAVEDCNRAIAIDAGDASTYSRRGYARARLGDIDQALNDYGKAIDLNPRLVGTFLYRAAAWIEKGLYDRAVEDCNRALELSPDSAMAYTTRGFAWEKKGDVQQAILDYERALAADREYTQAMNNLAWLLATCPDSEYRDPERAVALAEQAIRQSPSARSFDTLAAAYAAGGRYPEAVEAQQKAIERYGSTLLPQEQIDYRNRKSLYMEKKTLYAQSAAAASAGAASKQAEQAGSPPASGRQAQLPVHGTAVTAVPAPAPRQPAGHAATVSWTYPYAVQVESNKDRTVSYKKAVALSRAGHPAYTSPAEIKGKGTWQRVFVGSYETLARAESGLATLKASGLTGGYVIKIPFAVSVIPGAKKKDLAAIEAELRAIGCVPYCPESPNPAERTRVLAGGFETPAAAADFARRLAEQGFRTEVTRR